MILTMHQMDKLRNDVKAGNIVLADAPPSTPRKGSTKKAKGKALDSATDDQETTPTKHTSPVKNNKSKTKIKEEESEDEDAFEPKPIEKKRKSSTSAGGLKKATKSKSGKKAVQEEIPEDTEAE